MRARIMLLLLLLLQFIVKAKLEEETGSRSKSTVSYVGRDFRSIILHWKANVSGNNNSTTGDKSIGKRIAFLEPDNNSVWKEKKQREKLEVRKGEDVTWISQVSGIVTNRRKRSEDVWIDGQIEKSSSRTLKMHAFIVKDEDVPECGITADKVTQKRYFMCSGVILDENHVLTTVSCIHQAELFEYHIDASLAVLVGALDTNSYVIKVEQIKFHPYYVPEFESMHHTKHDIAILELSCPIPRESIVIPRLPANPYDDIGHLCCPDRCKVLTVVGNSKNLHTVREIKIKHLPPPIHDDVIKITESGKLFNMKSSNTDERGSDRRYPRDNIDHNNNLLKRKARESGKAPVPDVSSRDRADKIKSKMQNISKNDDTRDDRSMKKRDVQGKTNGPEAGENSSIETDSNTKIEWPKIKAEISDSNVSDENRKILANFVKNSMSDVMTRILEAVTRHVANLDNTFPYFNNIFKEVKHLQSDETNEKISDSLGKSLIRFASKELDIFSKEIEKVTSKNDKDDGNNGKIFRRNKGETTVESTPENTESATDGNEQPNVTEAPKSDKTQSSFNYENHVHCPPLGSPVIINNTLIALVAYTCDDAQDWVEWKYVDVIHNIQWIRNVMEKNVINPETTSSCDTMK